MRNWIPYTLLGVVIVVATFMVVQETTREKVIYAGADNVEHGITSISQRFERALIDNEFMPTSSNWHDTLHTDQATMH